MPALFPFETSRVARDFLSAERYQQACALLWSTDRRAATQGTRAAAAPGEIVYAKADHHRPLFAQLARSPARIVLATAESDCVITDEVEASRPHQIAAWFSTNAVSPAVHPLPLGLACSYCQVTLKAGALAQSFLPNENRLRWLYVNFRPETNPSARQPIWEHFQNLRGDWLTLRPGGLSLDEFLAEMTSHRFVLCPPGNGIDTHRLWEALYSRTIPIVQKHRAFRDFEDLPILFVEDFREITEAFLRAAWERLAATAWNSEKLFAPYWQSQIRAAAERLRASRQTRLAPASFLWSRVTGLLASRR